MAIQQKGEPPLSPCCKRPVELALMTIAHAQPDGPLMAAAWTCKQCGQDGGIYYDSEITMQAARELLGQ